MEIEEDPTYTNYIQRDLRTNIICGCCHVVNWTIKEGEETCYWEKCTFHGGMLKCHLTKKIGKSLNWDLAEAKKQLEEKQQKIIDIEAQLRYCETLPSED
jgi:hypothetical protein